MAEIENINLNINHAIIRPCGSIKLCWFCIRIHILCNLWILIILNWRDGVELEILFEFFSVCIFLYEI